MFYTLDESHAHTHVTLNSHLQFYNSHDFGQWEETVGHEENMQTYDCQDTLSTSSSSH